MGQSPEAGLPSRDRKIEGTSCVSKAISKQELRVAVVAPWLLLSAFRYPTLHEVVGFLHLRSPNSTPYFFLCSLLTLWRRVDRSLDYCVYNFVYHPILYHESKGVQLIFSFSSFLFFFFIFLIFFLFLFLIFWCVSVPLWSWLLILYLCCRCFFKNKQFSVFWFVVDFHSGKSN